MDELNELKTNVALADNIRSIRRGVDGIKKTLTNVSKGLFP